MPSANSARTGINIKIGYQPVGSPANTVFTFLGTVMSLSAPKISVGEAEATLLTSQIKDYVATLPEAEAGFKLRLDPGDLGVIAIKAMLNNPPVLKQTWQILYPDASSQVFDGFPKSWEPDEYTQENVLMATVGIRCTSTIKENPAPAGP